MKFSLIMATLGRFEEIKIFLDSLSNQDFRDFELIIVDQNADDSIKHIIEPYQNNFCIKHVRIKEKGLSLARNVGLKYAVGSIIAFPDDDCAYSEGILRYINDFFINNREVDFLTFRLRDKKTEEDANLKWYDKDVIITYYNIFRTVISPSIFIRVKKIDDIYFDEKLGVGRKYGSGEESDMIFELLHKGYKGMFLNNFIVYHPNKKEPLNKIYSYGLGYGATLKKHVKLRNGRKLIFKYLVTDSIIKPIVGMFIGTIRFNKEEIIFYKQRMKSRVKGYLEFKV